MDRGGTRGGASRDRRSKRAAMSRLSARLRQQNAVDLCALSERPIKQKHLVALFVYPWHSLDMQHSTLTPTHAAPWKIVCCGPWLRNLKLVYGGVDHVACECACGSRIAAVTYDPFVQWATCIVCQEEPSLMVTRPTESDLWAALAATMVPLPPDSLWDR